MAKLLVALACLMGASAFVSKTGPAAVQRVSAPAPLQMGKGGELRDRIATVGNTQKITEAMRLVAAAKVRRAQEAVLQTRPFSETLQSVFSGLIEQRVSGASILHNSPNSPTRRARPSRGTAPPRPAPRVQGRGGPGAGRAAAARLDPPRANEGIGPRPGPRSPNRLQGNLTSAIP